MKTLLIMLFALGLIDGQCQRSNEKLLSYFDEPIWTDTASTIIFPVRYNDDFFSSNKIALWGDYYANILVYNFQHDTYSKLFDIDTYIESFRSHHNYASGRRVRPKNLTTEWIFLLVKNKDYNESGRIDEKDPSVLFVTSTTGTGLKQLTLASENVISLEIYENQGFGLIKIQRDTNQDKSFKGEDREFFFRKISLNDLSLGRAIEIN